MRRLLVVAGHEPAGWLEEDADGRLSLRYRREWIRRPDAEALSHSLPLTRAPHREGAVRTFFEGLLPEGPVREHLAERLGTPAGDILGLLAAVGGDCAGAVAAHPGRSAVAGRGRAGRQPAGAAAASARRRSGPGRARLPRRGPGQAPRGDRERRAHRPRARGARHHARPQGPGRRLRGHAGQRGVLHGAGPTPGAADRRGGASPGGGRHLRGRPSLRPPARSRSARAHPPGGLCQALALPPTRKYEAQGGPTLVNCIGLIRATSARPEADLETFIRAVALDYLIANNDAHVKNVSLLRDHERGVRLAPLYDLGCTSVYAGLPSGMAMRIGAEESAEQVRSEDWRRLAEGAALPPAALSRWLRPLVDRAPAEARAVAAGLEAQSWRSRIPGRVCVFVEQRARRLGAALTDLVASS